MPRLVSWTVTSSRQNDSRGNTSGHGTVKTQPVIIADTGLQSITIISCLRSPNAIIIPTLWLKIKEILRLSGTVSKDFTQVLCCCSTRSTLQSTTPSSVTRPNSTNSPLLDLCPRKTYSKFSPSKVLTIQILWPWPNSNITGQEVCWYSHHPITKIVNYSIKEGSFPNFIKMAHVTPFKRSRALIEISSKTTGQCQTLD